MSKTPSHTDLNREAMSLLHAGEYGPGIVVAKKALKAALKNVGANHPDVVTIINNLAGLCHAQGHYAQAEQLYVKCLSLHQKAHGEDDAAGALILNNLAETHFSQDRHALAKRMFKLALKILEQTQGPDHPDVAKPLSNLGSLYYTQSNYTQAESLFKKAIAITEKARGADHPDLATDLNNLALLYKTKGSPVRAEPLYRRSLAIVEKALGPDHPTVASSLHNIAVFYFSEGHHAQAEPLLARALKILHSTLGADHPQVVEVCAKLAIVKEFLWLDSIVGSGSSLKINVQNKRKLQSAIDKVQIRCRVRLLQAVDVTNSIKSIERRLKNVLLKSHWTGLEFSVNVDASACIGAFSDSTPQCTMFSVKRFASGWFVTSIWRGNGILKTIDAKGSFAAKTKELEAFANNHAFRGLL